MTLSLKERPLDVQLTMTSEPANVTSCFTSLLGPATKGCIQWEPNVDASPTFEMARRLIFVGAGDDFLHVLDADAGYPVAQISTEGRVITDTVFSSDRRVLYVGTEKGVVHAMDAFSFLAHFSFRADSKIQNNMLILDDALIFTSAMGSIYSVNATNGLLNWRVEQPLAKERLRLASNSNIYVHGNTLLVPHADGYVSMVDAQSGNVKDRIVLGGSKAGGLPDIVAPMVHVNNQLWVASYDLGLFCIDLSVLQIRDHIPIFKIVQLTSYGTTVFAASMESLLAVSDLGKIVWENRMEEIKARLFPIGYPFNDVTKERRSLFWGTPSRILVHEGHNALVVGTSAGSLGIFDKSTGKLRKILGNSVDFGPKIDWAGLDSFVAMSTRGLLMKFQFNSHNAVLERKPTAFFGKM